LRARYDRREGRKDKVLVVVVDAEIVFVVVIIIISVADDVVYGWR
jgi:hypothetical protein